MTYDPRQTFSAQQSAYGRASGVTSSKSNANKQAADSMRSAGIGGVGGKPTTSAAQRIQDMFREQAQKDDDRKGLGSKRDVKPKKTVTESLADRIKRAFGFAGGTTKNKKRPDPNPAALYSAAPFIIPAATAVTTTALGPAPLGADTTGMPSIYTPYSLEFGKGLDPMEAPEKPESAKIDIFDPFKEKVKRADEAPGLMAPPSMKQPAAPATAMSAAMTTNINKTLQSILSPDPDVPYVIQAGDTLSEIAKRTGTTVEDLVKENKIKEKDKIYTGNELKIPSAKSTKTKEDIVSSLIGDMGGVPKVGESFEGEGVETASLADFFKSLVGLQPAPKVGLMARPNNIDPTGLEGPEQLQDFTDVKTAQIKLAELGYDIGRGGKSNLKNLKIINAAQTKPSEIRGVDGIKGKNTTAAIKEFQKDNNLLITGKLDASTVAALSNPKKPTLKMDDTKYSTTEQNDNMRRVRNEAIKQGIDGLELVSLMSQIAHESDNFKRTEEYASGSAYEGRKDLGNTQKGDGIKFKGRSFIQITGRNNYKKMGDKLGLDLINNPTLLEDPDTAAKATVEWWKDNVQPLVGDFSDVERVTKIINGGFNGLKDRQKKYDEFLTRE